MTTQDLNDAYKYIYSEIRTQRCLVQTNDLLLCNNCNATAKTANMFLLFKEGSNKTTECYCDKHITEHLEEYIKELI